jgi:hypothetical protein
MELSTVYFFGAVDVIQGKAFTCYLHTQLEPLYNAICPTIPAPLVEHIAGPDVSVVLQSVQ